jgi:hypothetical protein
MEQRSEARDEHVKDGAGLASRELPQMPSVTFGQGDGKTAAIRAFRQRDPFDRKSTGAAPAFLRPEPPLCGIHWWSASGRYGSVGAETPPVFWQRALRGERVIGHQLAL